MSRVGLSPVVVPGGTEVAITDQTVTAKGKRGEMHYAVAPEVEVRQEGDRIVLRPRVDTREARALWGTSRNQVQNIVQGVSEGFTKRLAITGTGYRASVQGRTLVLQLGYSHDVRFDIPEGIDIACPDQTSVDISGADRQKVGEVAAKIRAFRKPEPYKGKGIRYRDEQILRKEGKKK